MAGMSFGQAQEQRLRLATDKLDTAQAQEWQKINDDYQIGMINATKPTGGGSTRDAAAPAPMLSQVGNNASIAAADAYNASYKQPVSNPSPGVYGDSALVFDTEPKMMEGGIIDKIKDKLGVLRTPKSQDSGNQKDDANKVANQFGGMSGGLARTLRSRPMQIEEELKRQGLRTGTDFVTDETGNGSPTVDTVDAKLAHGEAVLNAGASKLVGRAEIARLNKVGAKMLGLGKGNMTVEDGVVHAVFGGVNTNSPENIAKGSAGEWRRGMGLIAERQQAAKPVPIQSAPVQPAPVQSAPINTAPAQTAPIQAAPAQSAPVQSTRPVLSAKPASAGLTNFERTLLAGKNPNNISIGRGGIGPNGYAAGVQTAPAAQQGVIRKVAGGLFGRTAGAVGLALHSSEAGSASDDADFLPGGRFRPEKKQQEQVAQSAPAEPVSQENKYEIVNTKWAGPDRAEQAKQLDAMSEAYLKSPVDKRTTDMSNADFAARGMGDIAKIVDKDGNVTYTNVGNRNKFNNEEARARTVAYKAGEKARTESISDQVATKDDAEKKTGQFGLARARKVADLQDSFTTEQSPTVRAKIAEDIDVMTGKDSKKKTRRDPVKLSFEESKKSMEGDTISKYERVIDPETGQWIDPEGQSQAAIKVASMDDVREYSKKRGISETDAVKSLQAAGYSIN